MVEFQFFNARPASAQPLYAQIARMVRSENQGLASGIARGGENFGRSQLAKRMLRDRLDAMAREDEANFGWQQQMQPELARYGINAPVGVPTSAWNTSVDTQAALQRQNAARAQINNRVQERVTRINEMLRDAQRLADEKVRGPVNAALADLTKNANLLSDSQFASQAAAIQGQISGVTMDSDGFISKEKRNVLPVGMDPNADSTMGGMVKVGATVTPSPKEVPPAPEPAKPAPESASSGQAKESVELDSGEPPMRAYAELSDEEQASLRHRLRMVIGRSEEEVWEAFGDIDPDSVPPELYDELERELQEDDARRKSRAKLVHDRYQKAAAAQSRTAEKIDTKD